MRLTNSLALVVEVVALVVTLGAGIAARALSARLIRLLREQHSAFFTELGAPSSAPWLTEPLSNLRNQARAQHRLRQWVMAREYVTLNDGDVTRTASRYRSALIIQLVGLALLAAAVLGQKLHLR